MTLIQQQPEIMRPDQLRFFWISLLGFAVCIGCQKPAPDASSANQAAAAVDVLCTAWPLMEMTRLVAGDDLKVELVQPDSGLSWRNRRNFFPVDNQLALLPNAKLVIENGPGVSYVSWIEMSAVAEDRVCNSSANFRLDDFIPIREYQSVHSHGPEGEHSHDYMVPYCWHDPALVVKQLRAIGVAIGKSWPGLIGTVGDRAAGLEAELLKLGEQLKSVGGKIPADVEVILATPDLMFLARAMDLKPRYEIWFDEADDGTWMKRIQSLKPETPNGKRIVLFWPGNAPEIVRKSAAGSIALVEIDMLESGESEGSFVQRFTRLVEQLERELTGNSGG